MPKLIPNLENKILTIAEERFREKGFQNTDMREIAGKAGIAVGTIYHYYQSKEELYREVLVNNWRLTEKKLAEISQSSEIPEQRLEQMLIQFIQDMQERKALSDIWREIGAMYADHHPHMMHDHNFHGLHHALANHFSIVIADMDVSNKLGQDVLRQLGSFVFVMAVDICMLPPKQVVRQIKLILDLITTYMI
jgi:AcrR family transcriptional regulator